ncbi:MAG: hypothetical protein HY763_09800 [Planctomycetes bacterium]|nr:hypothetical protein [Planctomycetota bacterium]
MTIAARMMVQASPLPVGAELVGYVERHPRDDHGPGGAVVRFRATGIEALWDGALVRSLPRNWRALVTPTPRT